MAILVPNQWGQHRRALIYYYKQCRSSGLGRGNHHMYLIGPNKVSEVTIQNLSRNWCHPEQWNYSWFEFTTAVGFCKQIRLFAPQRVEPNTVSVQDIWILSRFSRKQFLLFQAEMRPWGKANSTVLYLQMPSLHAHFLLDKNSFKPWVK